MKAHLLVAILGFLSLVGATAAANERIAKITEYKTPKSINCLLMLNDVSQPKEKWVSPPEAEYPYLDLTNGQNEFTQTFNGIEFRGFVQRPGGVANRLIAHLRDLESGIESYADTDLRRIEGANYPNGDLISELHLQFPREARHEGKFSEAWATCWAKY